MYQPEYRLFCVFAEYKPLEEDPLDGLLVSSRELARWTANNRRFSQVGQVDSKQQAVGRCGRMDVSRAAEERQSRTVGAPPLPHTALSPHNALPATNTAPRSFPVRPTSPQVNNYANQGGINGTVVGTSQVNGGPWTTATIPDERRPSKLRVGIALGGSESSPGIRLGRGGDYWVVAAGQSEDLANRSGNLYGQWAGKAGLGWVGLGGRASLTCSAPASHPREKQQGRKGYCIAAAPSCP